MLRIGEGLALDLGPEGVGCLRVSMSGGEKFQGFWEEYVC